MGVHFPNLAGARRAAPPRGTTVVEGSGEAHDVATGAILGAPFRLATLTMAFVGVSAFVYRGRRPQSLDLEVHAPTVARDLFFFAATFAAVLVLGVLGYAGFVVYVVVTA